MRTVVAIVWNMTIVKVMMSDGLMWSRVATAAERTAEAGAPAACPLHVGAGSPQTGPAWAVSDGDAVLMTSSCMSPRSSSWASTPPPSSFSRLLNLAVWLGEGGTEVRAGPWVAATGEDCVLRDGAARPGVVRAWPVGNRCAAASLPRITSQWHGFRRCQRAAAALAWAHGGAAGLRLLAGPPSHSPSSSERRSASSARRVPAVAAAPGRASGAGAPAAWSAGAGSR